MSAIQPGVILEVVDLSNLKSAKRPGFAVGALLRCTGVNGAHVSVHGHSGWWKAHRFVVRDHG